MQVRPAQIAALKTEQRNPRTVDMDLLPTVELVRRINDENRCLADAVEAQAEQIAAAVEEIVRHMQAGGRLIYMGAGTSGRLGILDASECPPTFLSAPIGCWPLSPAGMQPSVPLWKMRRMIRRPPPLR